MDIIFSGGNPVFPLLAESSTLLFLQQDSLATASYHFLIFHCSFPFIRKHRAWLLEILVARVVNAHWHPPSVLPASNYRCCVSPVLSTRTESIHRIDQRSASLVKNLWQPSEAWLRTVVPRTITTKIAVPSNIQCNRKTVPWGIKMTAVHAFSSLLQIINRTFRVAVVNLLWLESRHSTKHSNWTNQSIMIFGQESWYRPLAFPSQESADVWKFSSF